MSKVTGDEHYEPTAEGISSMEDRDNTTSRVAPGDALAAAAAGATKQIMRPAFLDNDSSQKTTMRTSFADDEFNRRLLAKASSDSMSAAAESTKEISRPTLLDDDDSPQPPRRISSADDEFNRRLLAKASSASMGAAGSTKVISRPTGSEDNFQPPMPFNSAASEKDGEKKRAAAPVASSDGAKKRLSGPEEIQDDMIVLPPTPLNSIDFEDEGTKKKAASSSSAAKDNDNSMDRPTVIEDDDDDNAPMQLDYSEFGDHDARVKQRAAAAAPKARSPGVVSTSIINNIIQQKSANQQNSSANQNSDEEALQTGDDGHDEKTFDANVVQQSNVVVSNNENSGMIDLESQIIPNAYLVDDDDDDSIVVAGYAEPLLPWWKQRRTRMLLGIVVIVLIAAAVAIGISESKRRKALLEGGKFRTISPTQSNAPSSSPSMGPSVSVAPSTSPTKCSDTIAANAKEVDLNVLVGGLKNPKVAIDGNNMVVVANDSTGYAYTIFFKRGNSGEWTRTRYFVEECERTVDDALYSCSYSVALSGNTALVGLGYYSERKDQWIPAPVSMYRRSDLEQWDKIDSLLVPEGWEYGSFGQSVGIDGDLICVVAERAEPEGSSGILYPRMFIFRSISEKWEQVGIEGFSSVDGCDVSGDTIMAFSDFSEEFINHYQFDREDNVAVPIQDDFRLGESYSVETKRSLDGKHIVYSTYHRTWTNDIYTGVTYDRVFIYKRSDDDQQFRLQQRLEASDYEEGFGRAFDVQDDTLVVGGNNRTFIFLDHGDFFEESIILDRAYTSIKLSRRNVIATTKADRVESFVILEDCTQLVPTQTPSLSTSPTFTQSPSSLPSAAVTYGHTPTAWLVDDGSGRPLWKTYTPTQKFTRTTPPTTSLRPSLSPSLSLPPTEKCFVINIAFTYDSYPEETRWKLLKLDQAGGDDTVIKSYRPSSTSKDKSYREDMCLEEGRYQFIVTDWDGTKSYNVSSYGDIIVQGGKFDREETRIFDLPYDSNLAPSQAPSSSFAPSLVPTTSLDPTKKPTYAPSNSHVPSQTPSESSLPTETCYWLSIEMNVADFETSWELLMALNTDEYELVEGFDASDVYNTPNKSYCLPEGSYKFTIYDSFGDGLANIGGSYSLTSYGESIVQGGEFGTNETTTFDLPFDPSSVNVTTTTIAPVSFPTYPPTLSFAPSLTKYPSASPSKSQPPSTSLTPSQFPSKSLLPTETCYWVKLMVTFDEYESETTWELLQINSTSEYKFASATESLKDGVYDGSLCLPEGQYKFIIYDSAGDGICCGGSYNLTSYGIVIIQGGQFGASETTMFDLPFDPSSVVTTSTTLAPATYSPTSPLTPFPG